MAFSGTVFWAAGYAAGVHGGERLGALFVMGASVALLLVVLSILIQLRTGVPGAAEGAPARRPG